MNKILLKLAAIGVAVTLLLTLLMLAGCSLLPNNINDASTDGDTTEENSGTTDQSGVNIVSDALVDDSLFDDTEEEIEVSPPDDSAADQTQSDQNTQSSITQPATPSQSTTEQTYTVTLKQYEAMKPEQQQAYMNSFSKIEDYIAWLKWAQANDSNEAERLEMENGVLEIKP